MQQIPSTQTRGDVKAEQLRAQGFPELRKLREAKKNQIRCGQEEEGRYST